MKKAFFIIGVLLIFLSFSSCKSSPLADVVTVVFEQTEAANMPTWADELPPEGILWGIGIAFDEKQSKAIRMAEKRGRISIGRILIAYMNDLFEAYNTGGAWMSNDILKDINSKITQAPFDEAVAVLRWKDLDGVWWYRVEYKKADARAFLSRIFDEEEQLFPEFSRITAMQLLETQFSGSDVPFQISTD
jgi:hypothetical protein